MVSDACGALPRICCKPPCHDPRMLRPRHCHGSDALKSALDIGTPSAHLHRPIASRTGRVCTLAPVLTAARLPLGALQRSRTKWRRAGQAMSPWSMLTHLTPQPNSDGRQSLGSNRCALTRGDGSVPTRMDSGPAHESSREQGSPAWRPSVACGWMCEAGEYLCCLPCMGPRDIGRLVMNCVMASAAKRKAERSGALPFWIWSDHRRTCLRSNADRAHVGSLVGSARVGSTLPSALCTCSLKRANRLTARSRCQARLQTEIYRSGVPRGCFTIKFY